MEKERIAIIYQILINNQEITDESLIQYGLTEEEIEFLIQKRIIEFTQENLTKELSDIEDIAYYISSSKISLDIARKKIGIFPEQILLIKLIYARDFYIEGKYVEGDSIIKEIEKNENITSKVIGLLNEIKQNRNNYKNQLTKEQYTKVLSQK